MKCLCSFNNNYEVIGLCDIEKFNEQIEDFITNSWSQLNISENLKIPNNNPPLKKVEKVHLNIKIDSTKVITTPVSDMPSIENSKLTGKLLLVSGETCQNIFYSSTIFSSHSIKFNIPFTTYIALDKNADINDSYNVYPCIENIFIRPSGDKCLTENISLFLFAYSITKPPLVGKLPNKIIVKSKDNEIVLTIEFNKDSNKFIVKYTKVVPNPSSLEPYFTLLLEHRISAKELIKVTLNSDEDGKNFKEILNNKEYTLGLNRLLLFYTDKSKIEITNHPTTGETYVPTEDIDMFAITDTELVNKALSSKIKFINDNNDELATIRFMTTDVFTRLVATNTTNISTTRLENNQFYSQAFLYGAGSSTGNFNGIILGKNDASELVKELNKRPLGTGHPIKLNNRFPNKIIITNYKNQDEYLVGEEPEFLTTDLTNIIPYDLKYNKIRLKNSDGSSVLFVYFDGVREKLFIYSTGIKNVSSNNFSITIKDSSEAFTKLQERLSLNENADRINTVSLRSFNYNDKLILTYSDGNLVEITNIPSQGAIYNPTGSSVKFIMRRSRLEIVNS